jgi:RNA polymerase sigma factor (sigma-70 family)
MIDLLNSSIPIKEQWEKLYTEISPVLFQYGRKMTSQESLIEDSIHDVYVNLWRIRETIPAIQHPKAYLISAFRRSLLHKLQESDRVHKLHMLSYEPDFYLSFSFESVLIQTEISQQQQQALKNALTALSTRQREAIYLKFYENHSNDEVADIMKMEKSAVYTLVYKALSSLRKALRTSAPTHLSQEYHLFLLMSLSIFLV